MWHANRLNADAQVCCYQSGENKVSKFGNLFFKVIFIFLLGVGILSIPLFIIDFTINTQMADYLLSNKALFDNKMGISLAVLVGIISVALAIWDGQFVDDVKPTHWSRQNMPK
jgi:hypothetical protein